MTKIKTETLRSSRQLAKLGMSVSLGALVATGFMFDRKTRPHARLLHLGAGLAMIGFSYWHWSLYQPMGMKKRRGT